MTFSTGDQMTVGYDGEFYVDAGLISNGTTFISGGSNANVDFYVGREPHWRHQLVQLASLRFPTRWSRFRSRAMPASRSDLDHFTATMPGRATLSLQPDHGSNASMSYVFPNGFTVEARAAAVDVGTNSALVMLSAYQTTRRRGNGDVLDYR